MGMDVYGRQPAGKEGEYFRANVWSWRPIHALMNQLCPEITVMYNLGSNDGDGPDDQETCDQIADRIEEWMKDHREGYAIEMGPKVEKGTGRFVDEGFEGETEPVYQTSDSHLQEWVKFLRACGGFKVC
jgi:hypothetical protein